MGQWLGQRPSGSPPVHIPEQRCQKGVCQRVVVELRESQAETREATRKLDNTTWCFDSQVKVKSEGLVRAAEADAREAVRLRKIAEREYSVTRSSSEHYRTLVQKQAEDIADLTNHVADLGAQVSAMTQREAAASRDARAAARACSVASSAACSAATLFGEEATEAAAEARVVERVRAAEAHAADMEAQVDEAELAAQEAMQEAIAERALVVAAREAQSVAEHSDMLTKRREERAIARAVAAERRISGFIEPWLPVSRNVDEWRALSKAAGYKAGQREREYLRHILGEAHPWRMEDVAKVLLELGWVEPLMATRPMFAVYYKKVESLMVKLEKEDFGVEFALALRYDMHLTIPDILRITQAGCKKFVHSRDAYESKELLFDPFHQADTRVKGGLAVEKYKSIKVPRVAPPGHRLMAIVRNLEERIGIKSGEDGRMALRSLAVVVQELLMEDAGTHDMPPLPDFLGGQLELPFFISFDGTGFGQLGVNTIAVGNPYTPQSAQLLRIIGLGNCSDNKSGTTRLLGEDNLRLVNELHKCDTYCVSCDGGANLVIKPHLYHILDVAALRCAIRSHTTLTTTHGDTLRVHTL